ncbi:MAG TPA: 50S ribosomal protein L22 [Acidobacteriota bacterium]|nr:50S ribosomal protein L22 [Acidobacteriota bacterium]
MPVHATARLKYVSIPPRKMRLVAEMVKGMPVEKALNILNFSPRIAAHHIAKTLKSAAANALSQEGTGQLKPENLRISTIKVDNAPTAKRIRFQSMGRVYRIRKRHCHLTIVLEEAGISREPEEAKTTRTREAEQETKGKEAAKAVKKKPTAKKTAGRGKAARERTSRKVATHKGVPKGSVPKKTTTGRASVMVKKGKAKTD